MAVFYQSEIVSINPKGTGEGLGKTYFPGVQSVSTSFNIGRQDVSRLGRFSPLPNRQATQDPTINFSIEYVPTGADIENSLGLLGTTSAIDFLVSGDSDYHMVDSKIEISELVGQGNSNATINLISGVITSYSFQASVGEIPRTSINIEFLDLGVDAETEVVRPVFDDLSPTLRPQDIRATFPTGILGLPNDIIQEGVHLQSFSLSLPLSRVPLIRIGERKPFSRELQSPVIATFQMNALVSDFRSTLATNGGLAPSGNSLEMQRLTCGEFFNEDIVVDIFQPNCENSTDTKLISYIFKKPYLDDYNISNSVGGYTSIDLQFSIPVSFDNPSTESNFIISGINFS